MEEPQQVNGHFWDSLVKYYEGKSPPSWQHAYNTHSRTFTNTPGASSSSTPNNDNNNPQPNKQTQFGKQTQSARIAQPIQNAPKLDLQYDIIEDLKKTRANISMYDLLQIYPMPNSPRASSSSTPSNDNNNSQPNKQTQSARTAQPTQNAPKLDLQYYIIEDLKKTRANISMYDLLQIYPMHNSPIISKVVWFFILGFFILMNFYF